MNTQFNIPVAKPLLPKADKILPWLREIDKNRFYSNFGPLVLRLEDEISKHFKSASSAICMSANATLGLVATLFALNIPKGKICLMPSWTFVASGQAVLQAGLIPYFIDIKESDWIVSYDHVEDAVKKLGDQVGAIMVVSPFGLKVKPKRWEELQDKYHVPVIMDMAAAFDTVEVSRCPSVVSLHATKVLGAGEGGFVACENEKLIASIKKRINFGFENDRTTKIIATNAKMSEYHAAVGLASLELWGTIRKEFKAVAVYYASLLNQLAEVSPQVGYGHQWVSSNCIVKLLDKSNIIICRKLKKMGIDTRLWWGTGLHKQSLFQQYASHPLLVSEKIAHTTLGLPCYRDLSYEQINYIIETLDDVLKDCQKYRVAS